MKKVDSATQILIHFKGVDAAACIGISLAVAAPKGDWNLANKAGLKVLSDLPSQHGRKQAKKLATSSLPEWGDCLSGVVTDA